jgi:hypothetical protein
MKRTLLFLFTCTAFTITQAQKQKGTAYAITSLEKGASRWTEVRLVNLESGDEIQSVFKSAADAEILSARTGKAILQQTNGVKRTASENPFGTNSAACAYDKKNNRLYYTPMGFNQLRYIDLKAKSPKVYYFDNEPFGVVKGTGDVASQITRMVIAADGNGYALSNDGNHLLRFTTKKKAEITDLGALTDDPTNGRHSIHSHSSYGGDMIAGKEGNLYLIAANNAVYKISVSNRLASYIGRIKGLPKGYSTNGAVAEGNTNIVVSSSKSTEGYFRFDLNTLKAEKISSGASVYNASDLANALFVWEEKEEEKKEEVTKAEPVPAATTLKDVITRNAISVYPNPVTNGFFKISFADQQPGRYNVQLLDVAGKVISTKPFNLVSKVQVEEYRLPQQLASGNYLVRVVAENQATPIVQQLVIQQ